MDRPDIGSPITTASTPAGFQSLALELLQEISYQVIGGNPFTQLLTSQEAHDLGVLRAVCRYMNDVNAPILFRHLVSVATSEKASTYNPPTLSSSLAEIISVHSSNITIRMEGRECPPEGSIELYESWLGLFLTSARNVTSVHWFLETPVPRGNLTSISKSLSSLPNIQGIHLDCCYSAPLLHLSALQPLQKLSISAYPTLLRDGIDVLLADTPDLSELSLTGWYCDGCERPPHLPDIFRKAPSGQFLRLRSLKLSGYILPYLEPKIIPHLKSLRSLSIEYHISSLNDDFDDDDPDDEDSSGFQTKGRTATPSGTAHIWKSLQAASIYVSHLEVDYIEDALLDYIDAYSSLEVLKISSTFEDKYNNNDRDPIPHLSKFFRSSLAAHKDSIRALSIYLPLEVDWPVQASYLDSIGDCHHLSSLSLTLYPWTDESPNFTTFTHQLLLATQSLPRLNSITLLPRPLRSPDRKKSLRISTAFQESFGNALTSFSASAEPDYVKYPDVTVVKDNYVVHKTDKGRRYSLVRLGDRAVTTGRA